MDPFKCILACAVILSAWGCRARSDVEAADAGAEPAADSGRIDTRAVSAADDASVGSRFAIALSTSDCQGGCPMYDLKLDQSGRVAFNGRGNIRQQGWVGKTVPPEAAAEILNEIVAANYWDLHDVYREPSDGCSEVAADLATHTWNVTMDGPAKIVIDYQGCKGVRELEALREIPQRLIEKLALSNWLGG